MTSENVGNVGLDRPGMTLWRISVLALLCFCAVAAQRYIDLSLLDEGFLWYGAQRVLAGELPIRDFQAYDPGRYFWIAGWMAALGDNGIIALRWANAALAAASVGLATWVVGAGTGRVGWAPLTITALAFTLWMIPHIKMADALAAVTLLFGLARLLQRPSLNRYFQSGICLGLASTIGINHALYGVIAGLLALLYLRGTPNVGRAVGATIAGGTLGYSPVLALHLFAPGFSAAFLDSIVQLSEYGATNLYRPISDLFIAPRLSGKGFIGSVSELLLGLFFLIVPLFWIFAVWKSRGFAPGRGFGPPVAAGLILSVPYFHYAVSRADMVHLAISALPVLAALIALAFESPKGPVQWLIPAGALGTSLVMTLGDHPAYYVLRGYPTVPMEINGSRLLVRPDNAADIRAVMVVAAAAGRSNFFAGPYLPGAYALAERQAPTWEIYMLFPATISRQKSEIARMKAADLGAALISSDRIDGRSDLGIQRTHPLLLLFLQRCLGRRIHVPVPKRFSVYLKSPIACRSTEWAGRTAHSVTRRGQADAKEANAY